MSRRKQEIAIVPQATESRNLSARNAFDESMAKVRGVLSLITSYATEEQVSDVANACWLIDSELERLDEKLYDNGV